MADYQLADNRRLTIGRLSADYRFIHKPDILTLIPKRQRLYRSYKYFTV